MDLPYIVAYFILFEKHIPVFTSRAAMWSADAFVKLCTFSFFSFISGSIAPKAMVGVSMDSLWTPYYYVMDGNPEIQNRNREIRIFGF